MTDSNIVKALHGVLCFAIIVFSILNAAVWFTAISKTYWNDPLTVDSLAAIFMFLGSILTGIYIIVRSIISLNKDDL